MPLSGLGPRMGIELLITSPFVALCEQRKPILQVNREQEDFFQLQTDHGYSLFMYILLYKMKYTHYKVKSNDA
jgi:hypothetical protein